MKQFFFYLLVLSVQFLPAQNRFTVGLTGGMGQTRVCKDCTFSYTQAQSFGIEGQVRLISRLHFSARAEYQSRVHYYNPDFAPTKLSKRINYTVYQAGLQWKSKWWYTGTGVLIADMIGVSRELPPPVYYCGVVGGPDVTTIFVAPTPTYVEKDYSSIGYYFQVGFTPAITRFSNMLCELNWTYDFTGITADYPVKAAMPGMRLGVQHRFHRHL